MSCKRPKNKAEASFWDEVTEEGWLVFKKGWPDFFCFRDGELMLVEVKPKRSHSLKRDQLRIMAALSKFGVPCYRWSPNGPLEKIVPRGELERASTMHKRRITEALIDVQQIP